MNWGIYFLGMASGVFVKLIADIFSPTASELGARIRNAIWRKNRPAIKLPDDYPLLESLEKPLLKINQIPNFPDSLKALDIRDILLDVGTKAKSIKSKELLPIKEKLLAFSSYADKLYANMNVLDALKLFGRDTSMNLVAGIREMIAKGIEGKKQ